MVLCRYGYDPYQYPYHIVFNCNYGYFAERINFASVIQITEIKFRLQNYLSQILVSYKF